MKMIDLIQNRRSCRIYTEQKVEADKIEALQKMALWAPTSKNNRPWEFVFVDNKDMLQQLSECKPHGAAFVKNSPLAIVVMANPAKSDVWIEDCSIAASYLQLGAENIGLGSCWVQIRERNHASGISASEQVKTILNAPANLEVACIITVGYKGKERRPYSNDDLLTERIHQNGFE
nr:nitroreductase family protein [uncultured Carboxylicivirga sp.]